MQTFAIIGVGAVGAFIGWHLKAAGHPVNFVARGNASHLREHGLTLANGPINPTVSSLRVFDSIDELPESDVIVVATKTTDIEELSRQIARHHSGTTVIAVHNGLHPELRYVNAAPNRVLLGGVLYLSAKMTGPTSVHVEGDHHLLVGSVRAEGNSARCSKSLVKQLRSAGLNAEHSDRLHQERWHKLVWSLVFAGPCTILDIDTRDAAISSAVREVQRHIFEEAVMVAAADGVTVDFVEFSDMIAEAQESPGHHVSMTLDRRCGKPLEDDDIYGAVRRKAAERGLKTPTINAVHGLLRYYAGV